MKNFGDWQGIHCVNTH